MEKILIKGAGDLASGIAWRLQRAGFPIIMTEIEKPLTVRLTVSYSNAVYENEVNIEGIKGKLVNSYQEAQEVIAQDKIAVIVDENADIAKEYKPDIIIDAINVTIAITILFTYSHSIFSFDAESFNKFCTFL